MSRREDGASGRMPDYYQHGAGLQAPTRPSYFAHARGLDANPALVLVRPLAVVDIPGVQVTEHTDPVERAAFWSLWDKLARRRGFVSLLPGGAA